MRRLRSSEALRSLVRETRLTRHSLVYPMFVCPGKNVRREVGSMPGVANLSVDQAVAEAREAYSVGVPAVILFGLPESKDEVASGAWAADGIVQRASRAIKDAVPELLLIGDVCLCEYMSHGHCGVVRVPNGAPAVDARKVAATEYEILNDESLALLAKAAVSLANAGVDIVAPSDMMDGRVGAIRKALDASGRLHTPILAYAAKFASAF